jgi:hypothetical protein
VEVLAVFEFTPEREAPRDETGFVALRGCVPERRRRTVFRAPSRTLTDAHAAAFQTFSADNHRFGWCPFGGHDCG